MIYTGYNQGTTLKNSDTETDLKFAEKYGFDFFEFQMGPLYEYLAGHEIKELKEFFSTSRIKPYALNVLEFFNLKTGDALREKTDEFCSMCEIARELDIGIIILVPSPNEGGFTRKQILKDSVETISKLTDISQEYGIKLAYEFLGFKESSVNNLSQCNEIIKEVNRPDVGIVLDCFHFYAGDSRLEDLEDIDPEKIFVFHINDSKKGDTWTLEDSDRLWPGDGAIPLERILGILKKKGFKGVATIELFNPEYWKWDPEDTIRVARQKTVDIIDKYYK